jgi:hypothetical protein
MQCAVRVLSSYVNLAMFESIEQCLCIKFHENVGKMVSLTYQMMHILFRMKQRLRVEFLHGSKFFKRNKCSKVMSLVDAFQPVEMMNW